IAASRLEALLQPGVALHRRVARRLVFARHGQLRLAQTTRQRAQVAGVEDALDGELLEVARARVLRQVAHGAAVRHRARRGLPLPRQDAGESGLAGAVATHEAHLVARADAERRRVEQNARADAHLKA